MVGQVLKHYRILEQIGAGGMGVVYRAHDEELDRDVAIKVLPSGTLANDSAGRRFRKEALSLARLNHPNVATVHEFSSDKGVEFLVTEYIPGLSLDAKIAGRPRQRQIPAPQLSHAVSTSSPLDFGISHKIKLSKNRLCGMMDTHITVTHILVAARESAKTAKTIKIADQ
jgi:serine/threonine protein kinase